MESVTARPVGTQGVADVMRPVALPIASPGQLAREMLQTVLSCSDQDQVLRGLAATIARRVALSGLYYSEPNRELEQIYHPKQESPDTTLPPDFAFDSLRELCVTVCE